MYADDFEDFDDRPGRGNACCLAIFNLITFCLCLSLWSTVQWLMGVTFCQTYWFNCGFYMCRSYQCYGGQWLTTRPILQNMLPPPMNITGSPGEFTQAGNDEIDYWSAGITGIVGPIACLLVICTACASGSGRSGPGGCVGMMVLIAALMKTGCAIALGCQFLSYYSGRVVYNYFKPEPYVTIDTTLLEYLNNDEYMWGWGGIVTAVFTFLIITLIYDFVYAFAVLCANDAKYTGVSELTMQQIQYGRSGPRAYSRRSASAPRNTQATYATDVKNAA